MPWTKKQARYMFWAHPAIAERARRKHGKALVTDVEESPNSKAAKTVAKRIGHKKHKKG